VCDMNPFHRLHNLRMENDAAGYAMDEMRPRFESLRNRHENGTAPKAVTAFQLFQTPSTLADRLALLADIQPGDKVLEPSAGLGRLIDAMERGSNPSQVVAIEVAPQCAGELYRKTWAFPVSLYQRDFLKCEPSEFGTFDKIVMNPPFHIRADIRHILHALDFLKPGGGSWLRCVSTLTTELKR